MVVICHGLVLLVRTWNRKFVEYYRVVSRGYWTRVAPHCHNLFMLAPNYNSIFDSSWSGSHSTNGQWSNGDIRCQPRYVISNARANRECVFRDRISDTWMPSWFVCASAGHTWLLRPNVERVAFSRHMRRGANSRWCEIGWHACLRVSRGRNGAQTAHEFFFPAICNSSASSISTMPATASTVFHFPSKRCWKWLNYFYRRERRISCFFFIPKLNRKSFWKRISTNGSHSISLPTQFVAKYPHSCCEWRDS